MRTRVLPVVRKEFREIRRDRLLISVVVAAPVVFLFLFGYALSLDIEGVPMGVLDLDRSTRSAEFVEAFHNMDEFEVRARPGSEREVAELLDAGAVRIALVIPPGFGRELEAGRTAQAQTLIDGSLAPRAIVVRNNVDATTAAFVVRQVRERSGGISAQVGIEVTPRVWYNESLTSATFIVPGLFAVILMAFPPLLTALAIVREKESGSVQQIYVSPLRSWEFIAGKMLPYGLIAFGQLGLLVVLGTWWFDLPFRGSAPLVLAGAAVYVLCAVGIGLLISAVTRSQVVAILLAAIITIMPSFLFSGFLYPISSMPEGSQWRTAIFPARYFTDVSRDSFLKGAGWMELWPELVILTVYTAVVFAAASLLFRKKVA